MNYMVMTRIDMLYKDSLINERIDQWVESYDKRKCRRVGE